MEKVIQDLLIREMGEEYIDEIEYEFDMDVDTFIKYFVKFDETVDDEDDIDSWYIDI